MIDLSAIPWADLAPFIVAGFLAQLVDSALGMAFGVIANSLLVILGLPPAMASSVTHTVESFTSGVSGIAHALQRNVDWPLFARLVIPGIAGGLTGVWALTHLHLDFVRPVVLVYLAAVGIYLTWRGARRAQAYRRMRMVGPLGLVAGFLDSFGGAWGPVTTGSLIAQGMTPRMAVGTVNAAEFFVSVTVLSAFIGSLGLQSFALAASGLLIGGVVAAPLGALVTRRASGRNMTQWIGSVLIAVALWGLISLTLAPGPLFFRM
ncbi:sulfite exporter TauE/SafE family protein [Novosphingobium sp. P6W]|uniref:sulfite exporter TauE/SafE family protein n=1 Tax=Novosphingobium sp. P6W TaxID=1609758 RepID=UPI0005C30A6C|nr:sulfite exporter TauE/SafE family protein [Novosphingobium sp. P6W]AXB76040.1 sulfite exporter TauE/SafE family protein [Novosphingobium sp. P6W]KIS31226.1 membrane protein [Novosphingobium sp. P6W]